MRRLIEISVPLAVLVSCLAILLVGTVLANGDEGEAKKEAKAEQAEFIGASKCKVCHNKEDVGQQFPIWEKGPHAQAFATLASDEAKAFAKEKGIEDPQKADECLRCHVTGHGVDAKYLGTKYDIAEGVGCESCHGAGGNYYKKKTMESVTMGEIEPASVGLTLPTEETCVQCHNEESPTFDGFDFEKMVAKIAHKIPAERMAKYKKAGE